MRELQIAFGVHQRRTYRSTTNAYTVYLHQIACRANGQSAEDRLAGFEKGYQCSHLCHNPLCFNPDHLWFESRSMNQARDLCANAEGGADSQGKVVACPHGDVRAGVPYCVMNETEEQVVLQRRPGPSRRGLGAVSLLL